MSISFEFNSLHIRLPAMSPELVVSSLSKIRDIALSIQNLTAGCAQQIDNARGAPLPTNLLTLPCATSIVPKLVGLGVAESVATKISSAYIRSADELRKTSEIALQNALAAVSNTSASSRSSIADKQAMLYNIFATKYSNHTNAWMDEALRHAQKIIATTSASAHNSPTARKEKHAFNHVLIDFLPSYLQ